jgi:predicted nucleotidyltransferase
MVSDSIVESMTSRLVESFDPEKIILFGSVARGTADEHSDVDILVICPVSGSRRAMMVAMDRAMRGLNIARDIMVISPEEFENNRFIPGTIARTAWQQGITLYERT